MVKSLDIIDPKKELGNDSSQDEEREEKVLRASEPEERSGGVFYLVIGIIAVIVSASLALYILFKDNKSANNSAAETSVTATADSSVSPAASTTATSTSSTSTSPVAAASSASSTFTYTNEQIRIANGNNIAGEASRIKTLLEAKGLKIASVGNASKQYDASFIYYKTGQEELAQALKTALAGEYNATIENSDTTVGTYDAVVVLGAK